MTIEYLDLDDLMAAAEAFLGRRPEVRDYGLLESASARPQATVFGEDAYSTIHTKAAALMHSLASTRALVDGNKRLAWVSTRLFYGLNGWDIAATEDEKFELTMAVAEHEMDDIDKLAVVLRTMAHAV
jgi:death on curing protein